MRKESYNLKDDFDTTAGVFELSRIVNTFKVGFSEGTEWVDTWDSNTGLLPKNIRITINVADAKGNNKEFTAEEAIRSTCPQ